mgnify:FL=1|tara:strand:- start:522 stop:818 length:297 start_codon:yes stop_codon:yes gene_type:complete
MNKNPLRSTETGHIRQYGIKAYIIIALCIILLPACSNWLVFNPDLPKKINYTESKFVECPVPQKGYLCIEDTHAINNVLDFKKCQEQNYLLRELLNGQ